MTGKYKIGDVLREVGTGKDWTVTSVSIGASIYDLECEGNRLTNWPASIVEDDNNYKWVRGSDDHGLVVGRIYKYLLGFSGRYVGKGVSATQQPCYIFKAMEKCVTAWGEVVLEGQEMLSLISAHRPDEFELQEDTTYSGTTDSVPTNEGDALYKFFATPVGKWEGWSDVRT